MAVFTGQESGQRSGWGGGENHPIVESLWSEVLVLWKAYTLFERTVQIAQAFLEYSFINSESNWSEI